MKKVMRKALLITIGIMLCTMYTAAAKHIENVNYNYNTAKVEISGTGFEESNGSYATVFVLKNGVTREDYVPSVTDGTDPNVEKQAQVPIENGKFSYEFKLSNPANNVVYTAYVKADDILKESSFTYVENIDSVYNFITLQAQYMAARIHLQRSQLGLVGTLYEKFGNENQASEIQTLINKAVADKREEIMAAAGDNKKLGIEMIKEAVMQAAYVQALNENLADEVIVDNNFRSAEVLGVTELGGTAYKLFSENTTPKGMKAVLDALCGKDYTVKDEDGNTTMTDVQAFLDDFAYYATVSAIKNYSINGEASSGTGHVKGILEANAAVAGLDLANYNSLSSSSTVDNALVTGSEWEKAAVQKVLDKQESSGSKDPTDTGSSGSSNSRPSSGSVGSYSQGYGVGQTQKPTEQTGTFTDLDTVEWARPAIERLAKLGVVSGRGDGIFAPNDNVTRAEFLTMILNTFKVTEEGATCDFTDVATGDWYYNTVATGTTLGIASGYTDGRFGAKENITRQDAVVMLNNAITKLEKSLTAVKDAVEFADASDIAEYAKAAVDTFVQAGVVSGMEDGAFMPLANCTRAQAAVMLSNLMDALGMEG